MAMMVPSFRHSMIHRAGLITSTAGAGLLFFGSWMSSAEAQLGRCTLLQQQQHSARCERPGISSSSSLESTPGFSGSTDPTRREGTITGLPDLAKPRPHYAPMGSFAEPITPPIDGVRDYLNRLDPLHATQPIQPIPPPPPLTGGNR